MTDTLQQALDTPGCERLRDFAAVGPAQRAALELFVDRIRAAEGEPVAWMHPEWRNYTRAPPPSRTPQEGWTPLYTAPPKAAPMTEEELHSVLQQVAESLGDVSIVMTHWPQVARAIEARKARPMTDDEMIRRGWRRCAVGQRTTQYCGQVEKAVAAEREACAKVCEREGIGRKALKHYAALTYSGAAHDCAVAIRARGEK